MTAVHELSPTQTEIAVTPSPSSMSVSAFRRRIRTAGVRRRLVVTGAQVAIFVAFIIGWNVAVDTGWMDPFFVSTPRAVADTVVDAFSTGAVWTHGWITLRTTLIGFAAGAAGGVLTGMLFARLPMLDSVLSPYFAAINAMPRVALAPLFILWFGIGTASKAWFAVSLVYFIVLLSTEAGVKSVDAELITNARVLGASKRQIFTKVILPSSVPTIFAGLRLGLVYALLGVVFGEMLSAQAGLGQQISFFAGTYRTDGVLAMVLVLSAMSLVLSGVLSLVERRLLRWQ